MDREEAKSYMGRVGVKCVYWAKYGKWQRPYAVFNGRMVCLWGCVSVLTGARADHDNGAVYVRDLGDTMAALSGALGFSLDWAEL